MTLELHNVSLGFGDTMLICNASLRIEGGEIISLLGPSGCGKTSLLRAICGLDKFHSGHISIDNESLENGCISPAVTMMFQQPVLYPHLNVSKNIELGHPRPYTVKDAKKTISVILESLGLSGFEARSVQSLSGGEAQRVAFGRALLQHPKVLLMDEPFANLDQERREELVQLTRQHLKSHGISAIHVTHDEREAKLLCDRIIHWHTLGSTATEIKEQANEGEHSQEIVNDRKT